MLWRFDAANKYRTDIWNQHRHKSRKVTGVVVLPTERKFLAEQFEANRGRLRGVAYRMLSSLNEEDTRCIAGTYPLFYSSGHRCQFWDHLD
jgi:hypothetical protein